jgi:serine/threonine protein kinase
MRTPDQIGRYTVRCRLGGGGMGDVFLCHDPIINRSVAVKVLRTALDDGEMRDRFGREMRSMGRLKHRNIVTVYDAGEHDGMPFIAMEYVDGRSMARIIANQEPLSLRVRLGLMDDLCEGLACAHARGLIHRDIKPANLVIGQDGTLRILDFGIARLLETTHASVSNVGTPGYMSPEQIMVDQIDQRSDLFNVGLVLYELLSFTRAFAGETLPRIMQMILHEEPQPLAALVPDLDIALIAIVTRALKKRAEDRYPDVLAMAAALRDVRARLPADPPFLQPTMREARPTPTPTLPKPATTIARSAEPTLAGQPSNTQPSDAQPSDARPSVEQPSAEQPSAEQRVAPARRTAFQWSWVPRCVPAVVAVLVAIILRLAVPTDGPLGFLWALPSTMWEVSAMLLPLIVVASCAVSTTSAISRVVLTVSALGAFTSPVWALLDLRADRFAWDGRVSGIERGIFETFTSLPAILICALALAIAWLPTRSPRVFRATMVTLVLLVGAVTLLDILVMHDIPDLQAGSPVGGVSGTLVALVLRLVAP